MPQGFPGVDSSMNRPNSGWKTGIGSCLRLLASRSAWKVNCATFEHLAAREQLPHVAATFHLRPMRQGYLLALVTSEPCSAHYRMQRPSTRPKLLISPHLEEECSWLTSSPQSSASHSLPFALFQIIKSCYWQSDSNYR